MSRKAGIHTEVRVTSHSMLFPCCESLRNNQSTGTKTKLQVKCVYEDSLSPTNIWLPWDPDFVMTYEESRRALQYFTLPKAQGCHPNPPFLL